MEERKGCRLVMYMGGSGGGGGMRPAVVVGCRARCRSFEAVRWLARQEETGGVALVTDSPL